MMVSVGRVWFWAKKCVVQESLFLLYELSSMMVSVGRVWFWAKSVSCKRACWEGSGSGQKVCLARELVLVV